MTRLRPALVGALILLLAALFGQAQPAIAGAAGLAASPIEAIAADGPPIEALFAPSLSFEDDPDDLTDPVGTAEGPAGRPASRRVESQHADVARRLGRPRATGPPAETPRD